MELTELIKPLVIYHSPCQDGFTAAWAVWKAHPDWEFYPAKHGDPPPDVTDRVVYIVDFSYKRPVLLEMAANAYWIYILDHHKTAQEDLLGELAPNVSVQFNMDKSGAHLAWNYFHPEEELPPIVKMVEDRDLWLFKYSITKAYTAYLFAQPYDFNIWDSISNANTLEIITLAGEAILLKQAKDVEELSSNKFRATIGGHEVWCVNVPYTLCSDMGNLLCKGEPFAATFFIDNKLRFVYSLRSDENGLDVSEIAKQFGGGGHKHAAGFTASMGVVWRSR